MYAIAIATVVSLILNGMEMEWHWNEIFNLFIFLLALVTSSTTRHAKSRVLCKNWGTECSNGNKVSHHQVPRVFVGTLLRVCVELKKDKTSLMHSCHRLRSIAHFTTSWNLWTRFPLFSWSVHRAGDRPRDILPTVFPTTTNRSKFSLPFLIMCSESHLCVSQSEVFVTCASSTTF